MASDVNQLTEPVVLGDSISVSVNFTTEEDINSAYEKLSSGGVISVPLADQFWGAKFGQFKDKFDVHWMLHFDSKCASNSIEIVPYMRFVKNCKEVMGDIKQILGCGRYEEMVIR